MIGMRKAAAASARIVDTALEATVAGSFGGPGIRLRSRLFGWAQPSRLDGRIALVTGATTGIGRATALEMAHLGAEVTIVGRDAERTRQAAADITAEAGAEIPVKAVGADLSLLGDARRLVDEFRSAHDRLDILVHNAGALSATYTGTVDGFEATYASQVLSPHIITTGLFDLLEASAAPRIITVSSGGMYAERLDLARVQMTADDYDGVRAYAKAKRAQVTLTQEWARRFPGRIAFHSMHPGWADTAGVQTALPRFRAITRPILRTPGEGADTIVWLAGVEPIPAPSGSFWLDRLPRRTVWLPGTGGSTAEHAALWELVCRQSEARPVAAN